MADDLNLTLLYAIRDDCVEQVAALWGLFLMDPDDAFREAVQHGAVRVTRFIVDQPGFVFSDKVLQALHRDSTLEVFEMLFAHHIKFDPCRHVDPDALTRNEDVDKLRLVLNDGRAPPHVYLSMCEPEPLALLLRDDRVHVSWSDVYFAVLSDDRASTLMLIECPQLKPCLESMEHEFGNWNAPCVFSPLLGDAYGRMFLRWLAEDGNKMTVRPTQHSGMVGLALRHLLHNLSRRIQWVAVMPLSLRKLSHVLECQLRLTQRVLRNLFIVYRGVELNVEDESV